MKTDSSDLTPEAYRRELQSKLKDVGVGRFNDAHMKMLGYLVNFHQLVEEITLRQPTDHDWQAIDRLLEDLSDYTENHFAEEEKLLAERSYPGLDTHKLEHQRFIEKLAGFREASVQRQEISFSVEMKYFLLDWLFSHINRTDMKYKRFLSETAP